MRSLEEAIAENICESSQEARERFHGIEKTRVELPPGGRAIYAVPREEQWQLPFAEEFAMLHGKGEVPGDPPISLIMRQQALWLEQPRASVHLFPQPLIVHEKVTEFLRTKAAEYMQHCPEESTWVQKHLGSAYAIGRYDAVIHPDGEIGICEIDGEASLWGNAHEYNQIVESHIMGFIERREAEGYQVVSTEMPEVTSEHVSGTLAVGMLINEKGDAVYFDPGAEMVGKVSRDIPIGYYYQHNDVNESGMVPFVPVKKLSDHHLAIPRGRRGGKFLAWEYGGYISFDRYMNYVREQSLIPAHMRDCKIPLPALNLGVLATKEHAFEAAEALFQKDNVDRLAIKGLMSARTREMALVRARGKRRPGERSLAQAKEWMQRYDDPSGGLVVMQPAYRYPTMEDLGLTFTEDDPNAQEEPWNDRDRKTLAMFPHVNPNDIKRFVHGQEGKHNVICRIFVLYDKTYSTEPEILGGLAAGVPGEIVHNTQRAAVWPLYCEGVKAYDDHPYYMIPGRMEGLERRVRQCGRRLLHASHASA